MKVKTIIVICLLLTMHLVAQNFKVDTLHIVNFNGRLEMSAGQDTTCTLNGKRISIQKYLSIKRNNCKLWRDCEESVLDTSVHVFFVYEHNMRGRLLRSSYRIDPENIFFGPYKEYYENGKIKIEGQYIFFTGRWQFFYDDRNFNKKVGTWKYYRKNGKIRRTLHYN